MRSGRLLEKSGGGSYRTVAHLRRGGMADLYLAHREGVADFRRLVAIKVVHPSLAQDVDAIANFVDEARITACINHPNVVHVEDLGYAHGTYFLVMEYVHGGTLAQLMARLAASRRRIAPAVAVAIAARLAEGLQAAHDATDEQGRPLGLIHRDVSPQNVLLSHQGHVKLIDFGIARFETDEPRSAVATLKGKLRYMSPEQARAAPLDTRSDVYALGLVLWEMLTMKSAIEGRRTLDVLKNARAPTIPPPARYAPDVDPSLDAAVMRALSISPDDRPSSARELRRELVRACPLAGQIDGAHLATLLRGALGEELRDLRENMPDEISRVLGGSDVVTIANLEEPTIVASDGRTATLTLRAKVGDLDGDARPWTSETPTEADVASESGAAAPALGAYDEDADDPTEVRTPTIVKVLAALRERPSALLHDDTGRISGPRVRPPGPPEARRPAGDAPASEPAPRAGRSYFARIALAGFALGVIVAIVYRLAS